MADHKTDTPKADAPKADAAAPAAKAQDAAARTAAPAAKAQDAAARTAAPAAKAAAEAPKAAAKAARTARKPRAAKASKPARKAAPRRTAAQKAAPQKAAVTRSINKINDNVNEGTRKMKNEANKIADRFQTVFGDVNERAQSTIERNTRFAEELSELGRGNVEAFVASTKVVAKGLETVGQEVAEFGRKSFEDASAALKGFAEVKSPADFFRLQSEFARSQFDSMVSESSKISETMIKLAGDVAQPIASRYSATAERVKNAVAA
jgi:phasin family protein